MTVPVKKEGRVSALCRLPGQATFDRKASSVLAQAIMNGFSKPSTLRMHARILEPKTLGPIQLRDKVLRNIAAQGEVGASWLEALPSLLRRLEVEWGIKVGVPSRTQRKLL